MIQRCYNPNSGRYSYYGSKNIKVCDRWKNSFENFCNDMGEKPEGHTLDRIDNSGNYVPSNCRWATTLEQANNRTNTIKLTIDSQTKTLVDWCRIAGINHRVVRNRLLRGKSSKEAVFTPTGEYRTN